jgi:hypothetical protein
VNWVRLAAEIAVTLAWLYGDVWLLTHPRFEVGGSPWVGFAIVTYFGVFFSVAVARGGRPVSG